MHRLTKLALLLVTGCCWLSAPPIVAQDSNPESASDELPTDSGDYAGVGHVPKLEISRQRVPHFVEDEAVLADRPGTIGEAETINGVFVIGADSSHHALFWDPGTCRLLGVIDLEAVDPEDGSTSGESGETKESSDESEKSETAGGAESEEPVRRDGAGTPPFLLVAAGPPPLSETAGASGTGSYFGMRVVEGRPEFLYTQGSLLVEERLWFENGGDTLQQHFTFREIDSDLHLRFPEAWRERIESDRGEWDDELLEVGLGEAGELRLTYRLREPEPESTDTGDSSTEDAE